MALSLTASGSTFLQGKQLQRQIRRPARGARAASRLAAPVAKYGSDSEYFDLDDLENTTGSLELYGQDDTKRYPSLQNEFFDRAAGPLTRRGALLAFTALSGVVGIGVWGRLGAKQINLPITVGPQKGGEKGPRGRI